MSNFDINVPLMVQFSCNLGPEYKNTSKNLNLLSKNYIILKTNSQKSIFDIKKTVKYIF